MVIIQTPLRISLFGGGTDFPAYYLEHGGCVLNTAVDKYIFVTIKKRFDDKLRIGYSQTEMVDSVDEIQHELIREALRHTGITHGVEITTMADIPTKGSGLGSSSTVTVGALHAMYAYKRELILTERLAQEACVIEREILQKPSGVQDQYIAAYGGFRFMEFTTDGEIIVRPVSLSPRTLRRLNDNLLIFFTGITRQNGRILEEQETNINDRLATLEQMKQIAYTACDELQRENVDAVGDLLHESWQLKKQLASQISNPQIDEMYETALQAGATGGKVSGAGGGGFLLLYVPRGQQEKVRDALKEYQELPITLGQDGSKVIFDYQR
ncbi:MAG: GHMP kinase [Chloroflexi bacterium]|nr:GHMP kinase [Chloroflexota bacterium]